MMQGPASGPDSFNGSTKLPQVVTLGSSPGVTRGPSVGQRAYERLRQRSAARAGEIRRERDERLNRRQLQAPDGAPAPKVASQEELETVASLLNKRLAEVIEDAGASGWYKLFNHIDDDGSGKISFWEFEDMVRNELKVSASNLTNDQLQAIWRALDEDNSGLISCGEFGHFMRRGIQTKGKSVRDKLVEAKQKETSLLRQEMKDLHEKWRSNIEAETATRRQKAYAQYAFDWGLTKESPRTKPAWKSPRAHIF